jgi:hypothetical protein
MVVTAIDSFAAPSAVTTFYPFAGGEVILVIIGLATWIIWHIWQIGAENRELEEGQRKARESGIK